MNSIPNPWAAVKANYSQRDEQEHVLRELSRLGLDSWKRTGSDDRAFCPLFLDIGAADGTAFSNTRALVDSGWGGMAVEASPQAFVALMATYKDKPGLVPVLATVVPEILGSGEPIPFHVTPDLVSTVSEAHKQAWEKTVPYQRVRAAIAGAIQIDKAFSDEFNGRRPHVVSVDVEGSSGRVFRAFQTDFFRDCQVAVVEVDSREDEAATVEFAARLGLKSVARTAENLVLARA